MKKLMMPIAAVILMASCQKESADTIENQDAEIDVAKIQALVDEGFNFSDDEAAYNAYSEAYDNLSEKELSTYYELEVRAKTDKLSETTGSEFTEYEKQTYHDNTLKAIQLTLKKSLDVYGKAYNKLTSDEKKALNKQVLGDNQIVAAMDAKDLIVMAKSNFEVDDFEGVDFEEDSDIASKSSCTRTSRAYWDMPGSGSSGNRGYKGHRLRKWDGDNECEWMIIFYENRRAPSYLTRYNATYAVRKAVGRMAYKRGYYNSTTGYSNRWYVQMGRSSFVGPEAIKSVYSVP